LPIVEQPSGVVTFVFTDIEGSTRLLLELGPEPYRQVLAEHRAVVRAAFGGRGGYEVDYEGDSFFYAFASAADALDAVTEALAALEDGPVRIRVGVHTGEPVLDPPKYVGVDVHHAARVMAAGHGRQVLVSSATQSLAEARHDLID
jgi:class 3 adenylate cyclase